MKVNESRFEVRLAQTEAEIASAQRLRYRVFVEEMGAPAPMADHDLRLEKDAFDPYFDHLILMDHARTCDDPLDQIIGVYRLMRKEVAREAIGFYGANEYDLTKLLESPRRSVELGRSCVAPEVRGGAAMHLLWNGLAEYVLSRDIEIMFGVASFHGTDPDQIGQALSFLYYNHLAPDDLRVTTQPEHFVHMALLPEPEVDRKVAMQQTPALIKAYLRLGGFVGDGAYIDHAFNTTDVCLIMDTTRMVNRYRDYYTASHKAEVG